MLHPYTTDTITNTEPDACALKPVNTPCGHNDYSLIRLDHNVKTLALPVYAYLPL